MNRGKTNSLSLSSSLVVSSNRTRQCRAVVADLIAEYEAAESSDYLNPSPEKASES